MNSIMTRHKGWDLAWMACIFVVYFGIVGLVASWLLNNEAVSLPSTPQAKIVGDNDSPVRVALTIGPPSAELGDPLKISLSGISVLSPKLSLTRPYRICVDNVRLVQVIGQKSTGTTALGSPTQGSCYGLTTGSGKSYPEYLIYTTSRVVDNSFEASVQQQNILSSPSEGGMPIVGPGSSFFYPFDQISITFAVALEYQIWERSIIPTPRVPPIVPLKPQPSPTATVAPQASATALLTPQPSPTEPCLSGPILGNSLGGTQDQGVLCRAWVTYAHVDGAIDTSIIWDSEAMTVVTSELEMTPTREYTAYGGIESDPPDNFTADPQPFVNIQLQRPLYLRILVPAVVLVVFLFIGLLAFVDSLEGFIGAGTAVFFGIFGLSAVVVPATTLVQPLVSYAVSALYFAFAVIVVRFLIRSLFSRSANPKQNGASDSDTG